MKPIGKKTKRILKIVFITLAVLLALAISVCVYYTVLGYNMYRDALERLPLEEAVARYRSDPDYVKFEDMPKLYVDGVVEIEDGRFYKHNGIDPISIMRAITRNVASGEYTAGGSTITQQLAKNMFFSFDKVLERKFAEVFMASKIESTYTKEEILELYVNIIDFGSGYVGVGEAARGYYGKEMSELDVYEIATLIGVPNAPICFSPKDSPEESLERQKYVLRKLVECGMIDEKYIEN
jgi:membrane peptidoglycan carboxypeptidase